MVHLTDWDNDLLLPAPIRERRRGVMAKNLRRLDLLAKALALALLPAAMLADVGPAHAARAVPISQLAPLALPELAWRIAMAEAGLMEPDRAAVYLAILDEMVESGDVEGLAMVAEAMKEIGK